MILEHSLTSSMKIVLYVRSNTIKDVEENIDNTLFNKNHYNVFLESSPKAKETKTKIKKQDIMLTKLKNFIYLFILFFTAKETNNKTKR